MKTRDLMKEKIITELKQYPEKPMKELAKTIGKHEEYIRKIIGELNNSEDPELNKLFAKREAYQNGGSQLVKVIKEHPGLNHTWMRRCMRRSIRGGKIEEINILLKGLKEYCERYDDAELRGILLNHKKAGGYTG